MRLVHAGATLVALAALAPAGAARGDTLFLDNTPVAYHSPQHFALEIKGGPYSPDIDSTPGLGGTTRPGSMPFSELFTNQNTPGKRPPGRALITLELDWQFWHPFGSFGFAAAVGAQHRTTHAFQYQNDVPGHPPCVVPMCTRSGDTTALTVMPFTLELVYRFDVLALRYKVPFVPYLKGGVGYYFWFWQSGDGSLAKSLPDAKGQNMSGIGGTFGLVAHPGLAFMLDIIDPAAARTLDAELGINHTYLFAELNYAWVTGLGFKDKMVLSDITWDTGIAFEF